MEKPYFCIDVIGKGAPFFSIRFGYMIVAEEIGGDALPSSKYLTCKVCVGTNVN